MLKAGGARFAVKLSGVPAMESLYEDLPNFSEVLDDIRKQIALCASSNDPLELAPLLLVGEPGIGKTHFGRRLAQLLATGFGFVSMSAMTAGWILSGASSQWKNAKPGKVFDTLLRRQLRQSGDRGGRARQGRGDAQYDPLGALYGLLERDTASQFVDEFVEIPVDASSLVWIATANDAARIPEPILNRVNVYEIEAPDREGARRIAQSHLLGNPRRPRLGQGLSRGAGAGGAGRACRPGAARDAPRAHDRVRQRQARRARRNPARAT